jgi:hypothetical protein
VTASGTPNSTSAPTVIPIPLALGAGFDNVQDLADRADITIT